MKSTPPKNWTIERKRNVDGLKKSSRSFFARWNTVSWYWPRGQDLPRHQHHHHHYQLYHHYYQNKERPRPGNGQDLPIFPTLSQGLAEEINKCVHDIDGLGRSNIMRLKKSKRGHFGRFMGTKNGTWGARIKIRRPLFNTNTPPKTPI